MSDWKTKLTEVASNLGFGGSKTKQKEKRGIDVSQWFPDKEPLGGKQNVLKPSIVAAARKPTAASAPAPPPAKSTSTICSSTSARVPIKPAKVHASASRLSLRPSHVPTNPSHPTGSTIKKPLLEEKIFRFPDIAGLVVNFPECVAKGSVPNVPRTDNTQRSGQAMDCVLGLDFGTSFTKACVRVREKHYFVHWDGCVEYPQAYLLPSFLTELKDGTCLLGCTQQGSAKVHGGLKMALLSTPTFETSVRAVVFLALVMRYVRVWMASEHGNVIAGYELNWLINIGLPARHWDQETEQCIFFRRIALAAWRMSTCSGALHVKDAETVWNALEGESNSGSAEATGELAVIAALPEFGAQIQSYKSVSHAEDLHMLVDVGAGTVDVVTFHLTPDGKANCIMASVVPSAGTHVLLKARADRARLEQPSWGDADTQMSCQEFAGAHCVDAAVIDAADREFSEALGLCVRKVLSETFTTRYSRSPKKNKLPYFLTGGGKEMTVYKRSPGAGAHNIMGEQGLDRQQFPIPEKASVELGSIPNADFHRVSVAHGLSFDSFNVTELFRQSETEDLPRVDSTKPKFTESYIEK